MRIQVYNKGKLPTIDYRKIKPLQGNLKDFHKDEYEKLGNSLKEFGFRFPFFIWIDKDETPWTIDGHGRLRFFNNENVINQAGGFDFPYVLIEADDKIQAKKLLLVATSQYQKITQEGLDEFSFDLPEDFVSEFTHFDGVFEYPVANKYSESKDLSNNIETIFEIVIECDSEAIQEQYYNKLITEGYKCRILTL